MPRKPSEFNPLRRTRPNPTGGLGRNYTPPMVPTYRVPPNPNIGLLRGLSNLSSSLGEYLAAKQEPVKREQELEAERIVAQEEASAVADRLREYERTGELPPGYSIHLMKHTNRQLARKMFRGMDDAAGQALFQFDDPDFEVSPEDHFGAIERTSLEEVGGKVSSLDFQEEWSALRQSRFEEWRKEAVARRGKARLGRAVDDQGDLFTDSFENYMAGGLTPDEVVLMNKEIDGLMKEFADNIQEGSGVVTPPGTLKALVWGRAKAFADNLIKSERYDDAEAFLDAFEVLNPKGELNVEGRTVIDEPGGGFSTEKTITVESGGKFLVIPGRKPKSADEYATPYQALQAALQLGEIRGEFDTEEEANAFAEQRSTEQGEKVKAAGLPDNMSVADYNKKNTFAYDYQAQIGDVRADLAKARGGATGGGDAKAVTTRNTITSGHILNIKATPSLTQWRQDNPMATPAEVRWEVARIVTEAFKDNDEVDTAMQNRIIQGVSEDLENKIAADARGNIQNISNQEASIQAREAVGSFEVELAKADTYAEVNTVLNKAKNDPRLKTDWGQAQLAELEEKAITAKQRRIAVAERMGTDLNAAMASLQTELGGVARDILEDVMPEVSRRPGGEAANLPKTVEDILTEELAGWEAAAHQMLIEFVKSDEDIELSELRSSLKTEINTWKEGIKETLEEKIRPRLEGVRTDTAETLVDAPSAAVQIKRKDLDTADITWGPWEGAGQVGEFTEQFFTPDDPKAQVKAWSSGDGANEVHDFRISINDQMVRPEWDTEGYRGGKRLDGVPIASKEAKGWRSFDNTQKEWDAHHKVYQGLNAVMGWADKRDILKFNKDKSYRDEEGWNHDEGYFNPKFFAVVPPSVLNDKALGDADKKTGFFEEEDAQGKVWGELFSEASSEEKIKMIEEGKKDPRAVEFFKRYDALPDQYKASPAVIYALQINAQKAYTDGVKGREF